MSDEHLRYPVGKFKAQESYTSQEREQCISRIEAVPSMIEAEAASLTAEQLETPYREGGWTARQVLHHVVDSHMNAYVRLKWTLTEETPTIKAYDEKLWAETPEVILDPSVSIALLKVLHTKWVLILRNLRPEHWSRSFMHPETGKLFTLERQLALYAWHGEHHLGHIKIVAGK